MAPALSPHLKFSRSAAGANVSEWDIPLKKREIRIKDRELLRAKAAGGHLVVVSQEERYRRVSMSAPAPNGAAANGNHLTEPANGHHLVAVHKNGREEDNEMEDVCIDSPPLERAPAGSGQRENCTAVTSTRDTQAQMQAGAEEAPKPVRRNKRFIAAQPEISTKRARQAAVAVGDPSPSRANDPFIAAEDDNEGNSLEAEVDVVGERSILEFKIPKRRQTAQENLKDLGTVLIDLLPRWRSEEANNSEEWGALSEAVQRRELERILGKDAPPLELEVSFLSTLPFFRFFLFPLFVMFRLCIFSSYHVLHLQGKGWWLYLGRLMDWAQGLLGGPAVSRAVTGGRASDCIRHTNHRVTVDVGKLCSLGELAAATLPIICICFFIQRKAAAAEYSWC
jgi:hypothetical protein